MVWSEPEEMSINGKTCYFTAKYYWYYFCYPITLIDGRWMVGFISMIKGSCASWID